MTEDQVKRMNEKARESAGVPVGEMSYANEDRHIRGYKAGYREGFESRQGEVDRLHDNLSHWTTNWQKAHGETQALKRKLTLAVEALEKILSVQPSAQDDPEYAGSLPTYEEQVCRDTLRQLRGKNG